MKSKVLLVSLAAVGLAACGSADGSGSDATVLGLTSTNYVTVTQTPTTLLPTTIAGAPGSPGTVHPEEGTYVVAAGDFPSTIANTYKVPFADLLAINGWTLQGQIVPEFPAPGATIKIPPNWTEPGTATDAPTDTPTGTTPSDDEPTTTVAGGGSTCAPGEYTIVEGDFEGKVAEKLDTTVDALRAANANTKNYRSFFVGLKIKTPPKTDC
jgi:LysM repeat protein